MQAVIYLAALIAMLSIIDIKSVDARTCRRAKIDLHSTTPYSADRQTVKFQTVYTNGCKCMTYQQDFKLIKKNVQRVNTFGKCVLLFQNDHCGNIPDAKLFKLQPGGEWLNYYGQLSGNVQSFKLC